MVGALRLAFNLSVGPEHVVMGDQSADRPFTRMT
jgi:hypothetical protein